MDPVGVIAIAAVLVLGTAAGLWRRHTDGRLRDVLSSDLPTAPESPATQAGSLTPPPPARETLLPAQEMSLGTQETALPPAEVEEEPGVIEKSGVDRLDPALLQALGVEPARATLLQFSSAFCAPCRAVRRVSSEVAGMLPGVRHVEVDAESHLDAVRALGIWRTPTLLVLDADGRVTRRATGVPTKPHLIAALGDLLRQDA